MYLKTYACYNKNVCLLINTHESWLKLCNKKVIY